MKITALGFLFALVLTVFPLYIIFHFRLNVMRRFSLSMVRMIISVAVMAVVIWGAVILKSIVYDIVMLLLLSATSALLTLNRARLKVSRLFIPVSVGTLAGITVLAFYGLFLVMGLHNPFVPHLFLPFVGIIAGEIVGVNSKALQTYYSGLLHHAQLYNYILGNGGTHREALDYFMRRCMQSSVVMVGKGMSRLVLLTSPVLLLAMVMSGTDIFTAAVFQIFFYIAVLSASLLSLLIVLYLGRRYSFDRYERLRPVSTTSSSPSVPHDTDSVSQPQAAEPENHLSE